MSGGVAQAVAAQPRIGLARRVRRDPELAIGVALLVVVAIVAIAPGLFAPQSPLAVNVDQALEAPSAAHLFGTDDVGRDVFALPGLGRLLLTSIETRDYPVLQGGLLVVVVIAMVVNLGVDLLYRVIDPRVRLS